MIAYVLQPAAGGESLEFEAGAADMFVWEKLYPGKSLGSLKENIHMWDLYAIAHIAAKRLGQFEGKLDDFVQAYPDLDWQEMERRGVKPADPTQPGAIPGSSSS